MGRAAPTILQIIPRLDTGGAELSTIEIAEAVVAAGGRALVATEGGRLMDQIAEVGGEIRTIPASSKNPLQIVANAWTLQRIIAQEQVDLLHARSRAPAWSARMAARRSGIPFVTTYHGAYAERGRLKRLYNSVMASADLVIANSGYTERLIKGRYNTEAKRVRVVHRGVDMSAFDPEAVDLARVRALREAWQVGPDERIVLQAARLTPWKGQAIVLEAAARVVSRQALGSIVFVFAGDHQGRTDYRDELAARAKALGISHLVRFPGHVSDIPAAFAAAHVALVASVEPEAFGRTATEAQAMQCPVIATDIGAPPETVKPAGPLEIGDATGWLVPPGDPEALAEALVRALSLANLERESLGRRAREHVASNFTLEAMKRKTLEVYDELLATDLAGRLACGR